MANDCRDPRLYNARITFTKPQGMNKALCVLAPMVALLVANKDIGRGEEVRVECASSVLRVVIPLARTPHQHCTRRDSHPYSLG